METVTNDLYIEEHKIKSIKDIGNDFKEVEYEDYPNKDIIHKDIFDLVKSTEPSDKTTSADKRNKFITEKILELLNYYGVRPSDIYAVNKRVELSLHKNFQRAIGKLVGFDMDPMVDPDIFNERITTKHIDEILTK